MSEKSAAAVLVEPRRFEMREFDLPEVPDDGALLKLEACGICGSDIHGSERLNAGPKILGHENVGIVTHLGKAAAKWEVRQGDRIALEEYVPCGACRWCHSDDFRFCQQTGRGGAAMKCNIVLAAAGSEMIDVGSFGRRKIVMKQANGHTFQAVELAIQFIESGKVPMDLISTHTFPMSRAMEAIDAVAGRGAQGAPSTSASCPRYSK